jgi:hypothetical protein
MTLNQRINYRGVLSHYKITGCFNVINKNTTKKVYLWYWNMVLGPAANIVYLLDESRPMIWKPKKGTQ